MTPSRIKSIRQTAGLSIRGLMAVLRIRDRKTPMRWESGEVDITGPASIVMELIESGELPARYFSQSPVDKMVIYKTAMVSHHGEALHAPDPENPEDMRWVESRNQLLARSFKKSSNRREGND